MMKIWGSGQTDGEGKVFTREIDDRAFAFGDFCVPVYHKRKWKWTQRKDLGHKMSVPMLSRSLDIFSKMCSCGLDVLHWYQGFDEEKGEMYHYLHRVNKGAIADVNALFGGSLEVSEDNGIEKVSGLAPIREREMDVRRAMSMLLMLQVLWGKWEERDEVLHGVKIAIPLISSTMQYQENIEEIVAILRENDIVIKMDVNENEEGVVVQLASRDVCLMEQFAFWHKPLASWEVISTKDVTQSLVEGLEEFLGEELVLESDQMIKIGSVQ